MKNKDKLKLEEIATSDISFSLMTKLLRSIWVLDIDSKFEVILEDEETVPSVLFLMPGIWDENKEVLTYLQKNKCWWDKHFDYSRGEKLYVFRK